MQGYKKSSYEAWKQKKLEQLLEYCKAQRQCLERGDLERLLDIQQEKMKLVAVIDAQDRINCCQNLKDDSKEHLRQILEKIAKCERELGQIVIRNYASLKNRLGMIGKGLDALRKYRIKRPVNSKFMNIKG